jgi:polysaccharide export outer membrane protein
MLPRSRLAALFLTAALSSGVTCGVAGVEELPAPTALPREILGPGDVIEVRIFNEPELSGTHQVQANGTVRLPLVGVVQAAGLTSDELTLRIEVKYNEKYLTNADVSIIIREFTSRKVYVLGQVAKPGPYQFEGKMTVLAAIAQAGGTTKTADSNRTLLTRDDAQGKQVRVIVEVSQIERGAAADVQLVPGDIIYVPESPL